MKLAVERGRMDRGMVVGCICGTGRLGRGEEGQMDTQGEETRSQWALMISFDLINERKIEVRLRIYWFSQDEPSMVLLGQKPKTFGNWKKQTMEG